MIRYLQSMDARLCCGCRACEQVCPKQALSMRENEEGFLYPVLDAQACIQCGLCSQVCPVEHGPEGRETLQAFAVQHYDDGVLKNSSSGGVFRLLADDILTQGGCVVGCLWDDRNRPVLTVADSAEQLVPMQGSKYVFSDTGAVYAEVQRRLRLGQKVLFTGAPCQCAGLLNYLQKPWDGLVTADFLCHGMPSQQVFDAYIRSLERRVKAKVYDIRFRDKSHRGWGMAFSCKYSAGDREKQLAHIGWTDPYLYGFIQGYFHRFSCYECPFRGAPRFTDITFCDYWGIQAQHPELPSEKGISAVTLNSEKAIVWQKALAERAMWLPVEPEAVAAENRTLLYPVLERVPSLRKDIYRMIRCDGWNSVEKRYLRTSYRQIKTLWYRLPRSVTEQIRRLLKR